MSIAQMSMAAVTLFTKVEARLPARFKHGWYLIGAATSAARGLGGKLLPEIYRHAVKDLDIPSAGSTSNTIPFPKDQPRRQIVRRLKETLVKATILVGVGHCIEASFSLSSALHEHDKDNTFVRQGFETDGKSNERGAFGLDRVYRHNIEAIDKKFNEGGLHDMRWLSWNVTYGQLLATTTPENPLAALTFQETELVVLSCLMAQHAHREVLWHLRGCLRSGMTVEEVESCQQAIEVCLEGLQALAGPEVPLPRVQDVKDVDDVT